MLVNKMVWASIPVTNMERALDFYKNRLGLKFMEEMSDEQNAMFGAGDGTGLSIYLRGPSKADHTLASWKVDDLEAEMAELKEKGIRFEEYDMPEMMLKTENGIATWNSTRAAWFKDPDGNIFGLFEIKAK